MKHIHISIQIQSEIGNITEDEIKKKFKELLKKVIEINDDESLIIKTVGIDSVKIKKR
jgi:hypothetical protein